MKELDKLTAGIRTGTFLVGSEFFKISGVNPEDTTITISGYYQFNDKSEFILLLEKSGKSDLCDLLSKSDYKREIFHIPVDFYNENSDLYAPEEDGLLFIENGERFYLTGGKK